MRALDLPVTFSTAFIRMGGDRDADAGRGSAGISWAAPDPSMYHTLA